MGLISNFDIYELLVLAALIYAAYVAFARLNDTVAAACIALPGLILLNSAGGTSDTMGPDAGATGVVLGNFDAMELICVASIGYGAWRLYKGGAITAAIAAAVAIAITLFESNDAATSF